MATSREKLLLACGAVGPPLFVATFLLEGATRPGYDARRYPVSSLAIGERCRRKTVNFLMVGGALFACSRGLRSASARDRESSAWESRLIAVAGVGLAGAGVFATDPVFGNPADAPLALEQFTARGHLHNLFSLLLFAGLPAVCLVDARHSLRSGQSVLAGYSLLNSIGMLATFVLSGAGLTQHPRLVRNVGSIQRLSIALGLGWVVLREVRQLRAPSDSI